MFNNKYINTELIIDEDKGLEIVMISNAGGYGYYILRRFDSEEEAIKELNKTLSELNIKVENLKYE